MLRAHHRPTLIKLFRPSRTGRLSLVDFVKSTVRSHLSAGIFKFNPFIMFQSTHPIIYLLILRLYFVSQDAVYKKMKLLRASVRNSQKIEKSFENVLNAFFYFLIGCIVLKVFGSNPIEVFISISSVVLVFSFMMTQASSKYLEGLIFILYRRPYDIGVSCVVF